MDTLFTVLLLAIPVVAFLLKSIKSTKRVPPGSLGLPLVGQSLSLLRAMKNNTSDKWFMQRIAKYGPISKLSLFGKPTVFIYGQAANKFVFTSDSSTLSNKQAKCTRMLFGERNLLELSGDDHKRIRGALSVFLRPESLKMCVSKIDEEVRNHLEIHWVRRQHVKVLPLMRTLTFNIICSLLFGIEEGAQRDHLVDCFEHITEGLWSIPVNFPFTRYNRGLRARARIQKIVKQLIHKKTAELQQGCPPNQDLITSLISMQMQGDEGVISDEEIMDNCILIMSGGHETSSIILTFMIRFLSMHPDIYASVLQEQEEIAKSKLQGNCLTREDLSNMKYTWRVASETLRMVPPVFGTFRTAVKDTEFGGYIIPKGWQVLWVASMTQMDDNIFPDPEKFDPSRFENQASIATYCFVPFGGGPRICPGMEFAKIETLISIHYLLTRFTWKPLADLSFCRDPTPIPYKGLPIQITPR